MSSTTTPNDAGSETAATRLKKSELDWNGETFTQTDEHGEEHELVLFCENCGAVRESNKSQPAGHRGPIAVCRECSAEALRKKSVEDLLSTSFQEGFAGTDREDKYRIEAEIEKMDFDEEKRISVEARVDLYKNGEKKLTILETVDSGNLRPDEPDFEDTINQNSSYWMPGDQSPSKRVSAEWQSDEVSEMSNEDLALQVLKWIEHDWDQVVAFEYEEVTE